MRHLIMIAALPFVLAACAADPYASCNGAPDCIRAVSDAEKARADAAAEKKRAEGKCVSGPLFRFCR